MTRNLEHPASSINISENYTDLFQFMFTENEEEISLKATIILPQLTSDRDYIIAENTGFTFPKYISAENFNKVITFFSE